MSTLLRFAFVFLIVSFVPVSADFIAKHGWVEWFLASGFTIGMICVAWAWGFATAAFDFKMFKRRRKKQ